MTNKREIDFQSILSKLKVFTRALDIDKKIIGIKVSTYFGDARLSQLNDGYITSIELAQDEIKLT